MRVFARYLAIGVTFGLGLQLLFWLELGEGMLLPLFVWSYSQQAVVVGLTGVKSAHEQALVWAAVYVAATVVLWRLFERPSHAWPSWRRPIAAWVAFQIVFAIAAWSLYLTGVARME